MLLLLIISLPIIIIKMTDREYKAFIAIWLVFEVIATSFLVGLFSKQLYSIYKIDGWNKLSIVITFIIMTNVSHLCAVILMAQILILYYIKLDHKVEVFIAVHSGFLSVQRMSFLLSHYLFARKYWQVSNNLAQKL